MTRASFLNINILMAIRRCPYCKAIIDEGSEFCSNCGTQLLFPEDEYINEEVPGKKVAEEEAPEEENPKERKSSSRRRKKKGEEEAKEEKPEEVEEEIEFEPIEEETDEKIEEEEVAVEMQDREEMGDIEKSDVEKIIEEPKKEDESQDAGKPPEDDRDEYFVEKQEPAFGTDDLEKVIDPEEKEKAEGKE